MFDYKGLKEGSLTIDMGYSKLPLKREDGPQTCRNKWNSRTEIKALEEEVPNKDCVFNNRDI